MVERQDKVAHRLTGLIGEWAALVALKRVRQRKTGGLEMADHAHFHLALRAEARRVDDRVAYVFPCGAGGARELRMPAAGTMASLAVDTFGQRSTRVDRFRKRLIVSRGDLRVPIVAEHAIVTDGTTEAVMVGPVVARVHRPV